MSTLRTYSILAVVVLVTLFSAAPVVFACDPGYVDAGDGSGCQPYAGSGSTGVSTGGPSTGVTTGGPSTGVSTGGPSTGISTGVNGTLQNPLKVDSLSKLIDLILQAVVQIGAILLVFMLVWVGFLFVMARGNPEEISKARSALIWTVIGGLILLGAEAISKVIEATVQTL